MNPPPYFQNGYPVQTNSFGSVNNYPYPATFAGNSQTVPRQNAGPYIANNYYQGFNPQPYPSVELNFAPPAHELFNQSSSSLPVETAAPNHYIAPTIGQVPFSTNYTGNNAASPYFSSSIPYGQAYNTNPQIEFPSNNNFGNNQPKPYSNSIDSNGYPTTSPSNVSPQNPVKNNDKFPAYAMQKVIHKAPVIIRKENYFRKKIENDLIKRTECIGNLDAGTYEFDDYFETHIEKFFTPELHQFVFYHDTRNIFGIQLAYRDPWGKYDKETYKGKLHMSKNISPNSCNKTVFDLDYDDYLAELYVDGKDEITYFKLVTNEGKVFEIGKPRENVKIKNHVPELTRIMGIGGSYDIYLNGIYFYYN